MEVHTTDGVIQIEEPTIWQCLAPQVLVVLPKSRAVRVRVLSGVKAIQQKSTGS